MNENNNTDEPTTEIPRVNECPACGDEYEGSYPVRRGSKEVGNVMYNTKRICHARQEGGMMIVYLHGERR